MNTIVRKLRRLVRWSHHDADLREEMETHRLLRQEALERNGVGRDAAAYESRRAFGNVTLAVEDAREVWAMRVIDQTRQDVRAAIRGLRKSPGFTFVAITTLALGIGANTALFSIFSSLILRPLPVRDPASLAFVLNGQWSYPIWNEIRQRDSELFDGAFAWSGQQFNLAPSGESDLVDGAYVSGRMFDVLGVNAVRGRMIVPADDNSGAPDGAVAVISHRLWQTRFGGADDVVGRTLMVQRVPFTIVGVMPREFFGIEVGRRRDVMIPFATEPLIRGKDSRLTKPGSSWLQILARLKRGQSLEQGSAALGALPILDTLQRARTRNPKPMTLAPADTGISALRAQFETPLFALILAVNLVLLVACANIASLLLARALSRRRELSVRLALGSSRGRIVRLLFVESLVLAVIGAGFGLIFAQWGSAVLVRQLSTYQIRVALDLVLDWRVLAFAAGLATLSAITFGLVPVMRLKKLTAGDTLKDAGRGITGERAMSVRSTLVVAQIGVSFALIVAAGLFMRTFVALNKLPLGFEPEPLLVATINLQQGGGLPEERLARTERLLAAAKPITGVRSVSISVEQLLQGGGWSSGLNAIGDGEFQRGDLWLNATTPGWFKTMGIALKNGRDFDATDRAGSRPVAIVNDAFVSKFLGGGQAIGQTVRWKFDETTRREIVGVVGDTVYADAREGMAPTMYVPVAQQKPAEFRGFVYLTINTPTARRASVEHDVAAALKQTDPTVGVTFNTFDSLVAATVTQERLVAMLSTFFGGLALLLAAVGLYGAVAHAVRARQVEIGLRMALGAAPSNIMRLVFNRVGVMIAVGVAIGFAGSLWAAKFVGSLLFRMEPRDPVTFTSAVIVLVIVGVVAAWVPARRAARLDPASVLREG